MNRATLCIVDMQDYFKGCALIVDKVALLAEKAIKRGLNIVCLEYNGCGDTNVKIREALRGYPQVSVVVKRQNDGSREFIETCTRCRFSTSRIFMCGVWLEFCVADTAAGLRRALPNSRIAVVLNATKEFSENYGTTVTVPELRRQQVKVF